MRARSAKHEIRGRPKLARVNRYDRSRAAGIKSRTLSNPDLDELHGRRNDAMAEAAEQWIARHLGLTIPKHLGPDPGFDLVIRDGRTLDVKWSLWLPGAHIGRDGIGYPTLNLSTWKGAHRAKLYALVCGESSADFDLYAWAHGWASLAECLAAPLIPGRWGRPYHALGFDYLHPLDELR